MEDTIEVKIGVEDKSKCAKCGGACCKIGYKGHLVPDYPKLFDDQGSGEKWAKEVREKGYDPRACGYLGSEGCILPRDKRTSVCINYKCDLWRNEEHYLELDGLMEHFRSLGGNTTCPICSVALNHDSVPDELRHLIEVYEGKVKPYTWSKHNLIDGKLLCKACADTVKYGYFDWANQMNQFVNKKVVVTHPGSSQVEGVLENVDVKFITKHSHLGPKSYKDDYISVRRYVEIELVLHTPNTPNCYTTIKYSPGFVHVKLCKESVPIKRKRGRPAKEKQVAS